MTTRPLKFKMNLPSRPAGWLPECSCPRHRSEEERYKSYASRPWYKYRTDKGGNPLSDGERQRYQEQMISGFYDHSRKINFTRNHYIEDEKMLEQYLCQTHLRDYKVLKEHYPALYWAIEKLVGAYGVKVLDIDMFAKSFIDDLRAVDVCLILRADECLTLLRQRKLEISPAETATMTFLLRGDEHLYTALHNLAMRVEDDYVH